MDVLSIPQNDDDAVAAAANENPFIGDLTSYKPDDTDPHDYDDSQQDMLVVNNDADFKPVPAPYDDANQVDGGDDLNCDLKGDNVEANPSDMVNAPGEVNGSNGSGENGGGATNGHRRSNSRRGRSSRSRSRGGRSKCWENRMLE